MRELKLMGLAMLAVPGMALAQTGSTQHGADPSSQVHPGDNSSAAHHAPGHSTAPPPAKSSGTMYEGDHPAVGATRKDADAASRTEGTTAAGVEVPRKADTMGQPH